MDRDRGKACLLALAVRSPIFRLPPAPKDQADFGGGHGDKVGPAGLLPMRVAQQVIQSAVDHQSDGFQRVVYVGKGGTYPGDLGKGDARRDLELFDWISRPLPNQVDDILDFGRRLPLS